MLTQIMYFDCIDGENMMAVNAYGNHFSLASSIALNCELYSTALPCIAIISREEVTYIFRTIEELNKWQEMENIINAIDNEEWNKLMK